MSTGQQQPGYLMQDKLGNAAGLMMSRSSMLTPVLHHLALSQQANNGSRMGLSQQANGSHMGLSQQANNGSHMGLSQQANGSHMGLSQQANNGSRMGMSQQANGSHMGLSQQANGSHMGLSQQANGSHMGLSQQANGSHMGLSQQANGSVSMNSINDIGPPRPMRLQSPPTASSPPGPMTLAASPQPTPLLPQYWLHNPAVLHPSAQLELAALRHSASAGSLPLRHQQLVQPTAVMVGRNAANAATAAYMNSYFFRPPVTPSVQPLHFAAPQEPVEAWKL